MKTENTLENKAKFFAQYWGQHLIIMGSFLRIIDHVTLCNIENDDILQLKPLSKISDEDAKESGYYLGRVINIEGILQNSNGEIAKQVFNNYSRVGLLNQIPSGCVDYLRSKGYALPYMDLSVEDLIEYGWIKLEE